MGARTQRVLDGGAMASRIRRADSPRRVDELSHWPADTGLIEGAVMSPFAAPSKRLGCAACAPVGTPRPSILRAAASHPTLRPGLAS